MYLIKLSNPDEVDALLQKLEEQGYVWKNLKKKPTEMSANIKELLLLSEDDFFICTFYEPDFREQRWVKHITWTNSLSVQQYFNKHL